MKITESFRSFFHPETPPQKSEPKINEPESDFIAQLPPTLSPEEILCLKDGELLHPPENADEPRFLLDDSLTHLADYQASPQQLGEIKEVVQHDAEVLASQLLPHDQAEALHLETGAQPEDEHPAMLSEVILLARAYDATGDPKLKDAIEIIFETSPPAASDDLREAFNAASKNETPIMQEYGRILSDKEMRITKPLTAEERQFITTMRRAQLRREELSDSSGDVEGTGVQG